MAKLLVNCETYSVEAEDSQTDSAALSTDQRFLLDVYNAMSIVIAMSHWLSKAQEKLTVGGYQ